jgi:hypothetical protein
VVGGYILADGTIGAASTTAKAQIVINGSASDLSATLALDGGAANNLFNKAGPAKDTTHTPTIRALLAGGSLNAAGNLEICVLYTV